MSAVATKAATKLNEYETLLSVDPEEVGCARWAGWIGQLPDSWKLTSLRQHLSERDNRNHDLARSAVLSVVAGRGVIPYEEKGELGNKKSDDLSNYKLVENGDLVINSMNFQIGSYGVSPYEGVTSQVYIVLQQRSNAHYRSFLGYLLQVPSFQIFAQSFGNGILDHRRALKWEDLKNLRVPGPTSEEARAIAAFLDRETGKIDVLVEKKLRLIALLKEKRAALISHAVTKGLDPSAPMKDSGIPWLGQIPAHWDVKRLKRLVTFTGGGTPSKENLDFWEGDIPWVSPKDMKTDRIRDTEDHISFSAIASSATTLIREGALLVVCRSGILKHSIPTAINAMPVTLNQDMKALQPKNGIIAEYLMYLIEGNQSAFLVEWRKEGATVESIEFELMANTDLPVPPIDEQLAVVGRTGERSRSLLRLCERLRRHIDLLFEFRSSLISAAVTGKIDVRGKAK